MTAINKENTLILLIWKLCFCCTLLGSGVIVFTIQFLLYITLFMLSRDCYRRVNYYLSYSFHSVIVFLFQSWSGSSLTFHTEPGFRQLFGKESFLLICNHSYEIDLLIALTCVENMGILGNIKIIAKDELKYAPIIGWSWKCQEFIFVKRNWNKDKDTVYNKLKCYLEYNQPFGLGLSPEGTRWTKEKQELSVQVAKSKGLQPLEHILLPRVKGFTSCVPVLRKKIEAVYDLTCVLDPKDEETTYSKVVDGKRFRPHVLIRRIPIQEIPEDEKGAGEWLHAQFRTKDKLLGTFKRTGKFFTQDDPEYGRFEEYQIKDRPYPFIVSISWMVFIMFFLSWYLASIVASLSLFGGSVICVMLIAVVIIVKKLQASVKISSYGTQQKLE